jgi:hypothetical protein
MSNHRQRLQELDVSVNHQSLTSNPGTFPTSIIWVGLGSEATEQLIPILFGVESNFDSPNQILRDTAEFFNGLGIMEAPKVPVITDPGDPYRSNLSPDISICRVLPDSVDFDNVSSATTESCLLFSEQVCNGFQDEEIDSAQLSIDVLPEIGGIINVQIGIDIGVVIEIEALLPVYAYEPDQDDLEEGYNSNVTFPVSILSTDEQMSKNYTRSRDICATVHEFNFP